MSGTAFKIYSVIPGKGQLISECLLGVIDFPKNQRKFDKFLPYNIRSDQINKIEALSYDNDGSFTRSR